MAYDEALAERIRQVLGTDNALTEQKMFGGLAFLVNGNMAVAASGRGGLMVRVDPKDSADLVRTTNAEQMEMRGRSMAGWLRVEPHADDELQDWVERGVAYARALPPKK